MKLIDVTRQFNTDDKCLDYLEAMRWPSDVACLALCRRVGFCDRGITAYPQRQA